VKRAVSLLTALAAVVALAVASLAVAPPTSTALSAGSSPARMADKDCGDFATQAAAQRFYVRHGGPQRDPHNLDADGDGVACESNPCPCSTATGPSGPDPAPDPAPSTPVKVERAKVVKVVDGDTVDVRMKRGGKRHRVRILGIDTPEVYGGRECWGPQASSAAKRLLPVGTVVVLRSDPTQDLRDRYGRLLRYMEKARAGTDVGKFQVRHGNARVYVYRGKVFRKVGTYRTAQRLARRADLGLWGHC
jgi:endonuclease YncB( thermonuclease family)